MLTRNQPLRPHRRGTIAALMTVALLASTPTILPAEEEQGAREHILEMVEAGTFGRVDPLRERTVDVALYARDEALSTGAPLVLVEPGERVELRAVIEPDPGFVSRTDLDPVRDIGRFRQSFLTEYHWTGESTDRLFQGPDGSVYWRGGESGGRASYVTVEAAQLRVERSAGAMGSAEISTPGVLKTARGSLLILSGVSYDRTGDGTIQGHHIGFYPNETASDAPGSVRSRAENYRPPSIFYRLDRRSADARITRAFTLGELVPPLFPDVETEVRFVPLSNRLLEFLPALEDRLEAEGINPRRLAVLRGYVSPSERQRLGQRGENLATFSRFLYGDALALVVRSEPGDWATSPPQMADLTGDGSINLEDARRLGDLVKEVMDETGMFGGLGIDEASSGAGPGAGSPYVHLDLRGHFVPFGDG
ncbi:MAG: hypothetical protein JJU11_01755 [Candidatus Sumerlaeia bacterium]|nr:hypothetical protein [Candidatus Sumerlaeia bacterium]